MEPRPETIFVPSRLEGMSHPGADLLKILRKCLGSHAVPAIRPREGRFRRGPAYPTLPRPPGKVSGPGCLGCPPPSFPHEDQDKGADQDEQRGSKEDKHGGIHTQPP